MARSGAEPTEQPSARRLLQAREQGQVTHSRELSSAIALLVVIAIVSWGAPAAVARRLSLSRWTFAAAMKDPARSNTVARAAEVASAAALLPLLATLGVTVLVGALQPRGLWSWQAVAPDAARLAPVSGLGRLFSARSLADVGKGLLN